MDVFVVVVFCLFFVFNVAKHRGVGFAQWLECWTHD